MTIKVHYFASLKEFLGRSDDEISITDTITVRQVWDIANPNIPLPHPILAAVNMEYVDLDYLVVDEDKIAFFPPVTGG